MANTCNLLIELEVINFCNARDVILNVTHILDPFGPLLVPAAVGALTDANLRSS